MRKAKGAIWKGPEATWRGREATHSVCPPNLQVTPPLLPTDHTARGTQGQQQNSLKLEQQGWPASLSSQGICFGFLKSMASKCQQRKGPEVEAPGSSWLKDGQRVTPAIFCQSSHLRAQAQGQGTQISLLRRRSPKRFRDHVHKWPQSDLWPPEICISLITRLTPTSHALSTLYHCWHHTALINCPHVRLPSELLSG